MTTLHKITIHHKAKGKTYTFNVPEGEYILKSFETKDSNGGLIGELLPFSCRNGFTRLTEQHLKPLQ